MSTWMHIVDETSGTLLNPQNEKEHRTQLFPILELSFFTKTSAPNKTRKITLIRKSCPAQQIRDTRTIIPILSTTLAPIELSQALTFLPEHIFPLQPASGAVQRLPRLPNPKPYGIQSPASHGLSAWSKQEIIDSLEAAKEEWASLVHESPAKRTTRLIPSSHRGGYGGRWCCFVATKLAAAAPFQGEREPDGWMNE